MTREMALPPGIALARTAALLDADHDGDLDVLVAGSATGSAEPAGSASGRRSPAVPASGAVQLLRNNGNLTFSDITTEARVEAFNHARAIVPTDWDNRRDIDVLVLSDAGPFALGNARDGTFRRESGLFDVGPIDDADFTAATAADVNKDGFVDFFLARANAPGHFGMSDGAGRLVWSRAPPSTAGALTAMFVDYDADGLLDLFLTRLGPEPLLLRNAGGSGWRDVTEQALGGGTMPSPGWALAVSTATVTRTFSSVRRSRSLRSETTIGMRVTRLRLRSRPA
jgi:hypothetical protein